MKTKPKTSIVYPDKSEETLEELIDRAKKAFRGGRNMACKICEGWKIFCDELKEDNRKICLTLDAVRLENESLKEEIKELNFLIDKLREVQFDKLPF